MKIIASKLANAIAVPRLLLKELGVKVTDQTLKDKLEDHPDFPSIMAVSDCFNEWRVPNLLGKTGQQDCKLDCPANECRRISVPP